MTDTELVLQVNERRLPDQPTYADGRVMLTPPIDENYWLFRVPVSDKQAIVAFPKFATIGVGFQHEEDWNTNLPCKCEPKEIFKHIAHNKGDDTIPDDVCIKAIEMVCAAGREFLAAQRS